MDDEPRDPTATARAPRNARLALASPLYARWPMFLGLFVASLVVNQIDRSLAENRLDYESSPAENAWLLPTLFSDAVYALNSILWWSVFAVGMLLCVRTVLGCTLLDACRR